MTSLIVALNDLARELALLREKTLCVLNSGRMNLGNVTSIVVSLCPSWMVSARTFVVYSIHPLSQQSVETGSPQNANTHPVDSLVFSCYFPPLGSLLAAWSVSPFGNPAIP